MGPARTPAPGRLRTCPTLPAHCCPSPPPPAPSTPRPAGACWPPSSPEGHRRRSGPTNWTSTTSRASVRPRRPPPPPPCCWPEARALRMSGPIFTAPICRAEGWPRRRRTGDWPPCGRCSSWRGPSAWSAGPWRCRGSAPRRTATPEAPGPRVTAGCWPSSKARRIRGQSGTGRSSACSTTWGYDVPRCAGFDLADYDQAGRRCWCSARAVSRRSA